MKWSATVIVCTVLTCYITGSYSFLPAKAPGDPRNMYTHTEITEAGFYQAASAFLKSQHLVSSVYPNAIGNFFRSGFGSKAEFNSVIRKVISNINTFQRTRFNESKYSVNGEQIQEAHDFIVQTKHEIRNLLSIQLTDAYKDLILQKIGHCLFVIQSFYSNTNWVEMYGNISYTNFGVDGVTLIPIASSFVSTCKNCGNRTSKVKLPCRDNIILHNVLTSGYRSGQNKYKVHLGSSTEGKCSHGGPSDSSRTIPATGGINKETPDITRSPHGHLHRAAAQAAISATSDFLVNRESGLRSFCSPDIFTTLFNIRLRNTTGISVGFSMGTSESMSDDIIALKQTIRGLVSETAGTTNEPSYYVLTTFGDKESQTTARNTTDIHQFLHWVDNLSLTPRGDCPQYSMSGILKAISLSSSGSTIYVFTDASAKDCYRVDEVVAAAREKRISVQFLLTGNCPGFICQHGRRKREQREDGFSRRQKRSIFDDLALASGGTVLHTQKSNISTVLTTLLKKDLPSSVVSVDSFALPTTSADETFFVYMDGDMQKAKIVLTGPTSFNEALLKDPSGLTPSFSSGGNVTRSVETSTVIFAIKHPTPGKWSVERKIKKKWNVNITAEASIDFRYSFLDSDQNGFSYELTGNPISGKTYSLRITINNLKAAPDTANVVLLDVNRNSVATLPLNLRPGATGNTSVIQLQLPKKAFNIQIHCDYKSADLSFRRMSKEMITPVNVQLSHQPLLGDLYLGIDHELHYTVRNTGDNTEEVTVTYDDNLAGLSHQLSFDHSLHAGEEETGTFVIRGKQASVPIAYTISVLKKATSEELQRIPGNLMFTNVGHPRCSILSKHGNCSIQLNSDDCKNVTWTATARISFSGIELQNIYASNAGADVTVNHPTLTGASGPKIDVLVKGSCCSPSVVLNAVDKQRYPSQCKLMFGDPSQLIHIPSDQEVKKTYTGSKDNKRVGLIVGVVMSLLVVVVIVVVGVLVCKKTHLLSKTTSVQKE